MNKSLFIVYIFLLSALTKGIAQDSLEFQNHSFLLSSDTLHSNRLRSLAIGGGIGYGITLLALNELWYADYPRTSFQFFNDGGEWMDMDKAGHAYTAYFESEWIYGLSRWAGMEESPAIWTGVGLASALQLSIEILDAHSAEWGFSWKDVAANTAGATLFGIQQGLWREQRIRLKFSSSPSNYNSMPLFSLNTSNFTSLERRTDDLFGESLPERVLKDYNAQTYWLTMNLNQLGLPGFQGKRWMRGLNLAIGLGAHDMYGGYSNEWREDGSNYRVPEHRYRQYYLSLDYDWKQIRSKKPIVRMLLTMLNAIKLPFPALEWSQGTMYLHPLHF